MQTVGIKIANILTQYRIKAKMNKSELANRLGIATSYYTYIEKAEIAKVSPSLINRVAKIVGLSTVELFIELGYIDREYEEKFGVLKSSDLTKPQKLSDAFERGKEEGFKLAKLKFADKVLSLSLYKED